MIVELAIVPENKNRRDTFAGFPGDTSRPLADRELMRNCTMFAHFPHTPNEGNQPKAEPKNDDISSLPQNEPPAVLPTVENDPIVAFIVAYIYEMKSTDQRLAVALYPMQSASGAPRPNLDMWSGDPATAPEPTPEKEPFDPNEQVRLYGSVGFDKGEMIYFEDALHVVNNLVQDSIISMQPREHHSHYDYSELFFLGVKHIARVLYKSNNDIELVDYPFSDIALPS
jgi:hypothetical protein